MTMKTYRFLAIPREGVLAGLLAISLITLGCVDQEIQECLVDDGLQACETYCEGRMAGAHLRGRGLGSGWRLVFVECSCQDDRHVFTIKPGRTVIPGHTWAECGR